MVCDLLQKGELLHAADANKGTVISGQDVTAGKTTLALGTRFMLGGVVVGILLGRGLINAQP